MKNIKLLIVMFLFSSLLTACGMKGALYRAPTADQQPVAKVQDKSENNAQSTVKEDLDNGFEHSAESK